jgi:hypothetical protein
VPFEQGRMCVNALEYRMGAAIACQVALDKTNAVTEVGADAAAHGFRQKLVPEADAQAWFFALQPLADGLFFPEQEGMLIHLIDVGASAEDDKAVVRRQVGNLLMPYFDDV